MAKSTDVQKTLTVGDMARRVRCTPRVVAQFLYDRVPHDRCPVHSGRRIIPAEIADQLEAEIRVYIRPKPKTAEVAHA